MGIGITQGKLPYVELFDHKGPLIFYLYALSYIFPIGKYGLLVIQTLFVFFTIFFVYKTASLFLNRTESLVISILTLIFLAITCQGEFGVEGFEVLFISISLFLSAKYLRDQNNKKFPKYSFIIGLCFGATFLLRLNDAISQIGIIYFMLFLYSFTLAKHGHIKSALYFLTGFLSVNTPFLVYFSYIRILSDVWFGMFTFNLTYVRVGGFLNTMKIITLSFFFICWFLTVSKNSYVAKRISSYIILPILFVSIFCIGGNSFIHYYLILSPVFGLIASLLYEKKFIVILFWFLVFCGWNPNNNDSLYNITFHNFHQIKGTKELEVVHNKMNNLLAHVPHNEQNSIWAYKLPKSDPYFDLFTKNHLTPGNRFFVGLHHSIDENYTNKEAIDKVKPKWVLTNMSYINKVDSIMFAKDYQILYEINESMCDLKLLHRIH